MVSVVLLELTTEHTEYTEFHRKKHRIPLRLRKTRKEPVYWDMVSYTNFLSLSVFSVSEAVFGVFL